MFHDEYLKQRAIEQLVERNRVKLFLLESISRKPSLHWWVTATHEQAKDAYGELSHAFGPAVKATLHHPQFKIETHNSSSIYIFPVDDLPQRQGETPASITFDRLKVSWDAWQWCMAHVRHFESIQVHTAAATLPYE